MEEIYVHLCLNNLPLRSLTDFDGKRENPVKEHAKLKDATLDTRIVTK